MGSCASFLDHPLFATKSVLSSQATYAHVLPSSLLPKHHHFWLTVPGLWNASDPLINPCMHCSSVRRWCDIYSGPIMAMASDLYGKSSENQTDRLRDQWTLHHLLAASIFVHAGHRYVYHVLYQKPTTRVYAWIRSPHSYRHAAHSGIMKGLLTACAATAAHQRRKRPNKPFYYLCTHSRLLRTGSCCYLGMARMDSSWGHRPSLSLLAGSSSP